VEERCRLSKARFKRFRGLRGNDDPVFPPDKTPHKARDLLLPLVEGSRKGAREAGNTFLNSYNFNWKLEIFPRIRLQRASPGEVFFFVYPHLHRLHENPLFLSGVLMHMHVKQRANVCGTKPVMRKLHPDLWGDKSGHGSPYLAPLLSPIEAEGSR
jgi:hypothetical protein